MTGPLLEVEGLRVAFGAAEAVKGLSFRVEPGETLALVGESGSGKSATALSVLRLIEREGGRIVSGRIGWRGSEGLRDLAALPEAALRAVRGREIAMIFQEPMTSLNPVLTVGDQIAETLILHEGLSAEAALGRAAELLSRVRMSEPERRLRQYPHELSGGLRQRVMIAMALACRPRLLIADEPTTALDVTTQGEILALMRELQAETGMAVLFITHDMGVVAEMADRVVVLKDGAAVETAPVERLFAAPRAPYSQRLMAAAPRLGAGGPPPAASGAPVLEAEGVTVRFPGGGWFGARRPGFTAVEDVSLQVAAGETLGLVGESGCGKSTLSRAVLRLGPLTAGRVRLAGTDVTRLTGRPLRRLRHHAQMIFQDPYSSLNPRLPAWEAVTEPAWLHGLVEARDRRDLAAELVARTGLPRDCVDRHPHQFSGGQRQRLSIARALSARPRVIVADEPVSALDVSVARQVTDLMRRLQEEDGLAFLFISHDIAVVERMSHRIAVMQAGRIVETGPAEQVLREPRHAYTRRLLASVPVPDPSRRRAPRPTLPPMRRAG